MSAELCSGIVRDGYFMEWNERAGGAEAAPAGRVAIVGSVHSLKLECKPAGSRCASGVS